MHIKFSRSLTCFFAILTAVYCVDVLAQLDAGAVTQQRDYVEGEVLVKFRASATAVDRSRVRSGVLSVRQVSRNISKLEVSQSVDEVLEQLKNDPGVEYAQPNYIKRLQVVPNDTNYKYQWGLKNTEQRVPHLLGEPGVAGADISAEQAWEVTTGNRDVVIAILDSGIDPGHPEFSSVLWRNDIEVAGMPGVDDDVNGYIDDFAGWDMVNEDNRVLDLNGHGTQMAGIIAAQGNNGGDVAGVMWEVTIMPLQIFDVNGAATTANIIQAIDYAIAQGAHIINASYGSQGFDQAEYDAISRANDAGVLLVAAACNEMADNDSISALTSCMPSSYPLSNIIAVAATDHLDRLSSFSNFGASTVDLAAPGENIISTELAFERVWTTNAFDLSSETPSIDLSGRKACQLVVEKSAPNFDALSVSVLENQAGWQSEGILLFQDNVGFFDLSKFDDAADLRVKVVALMGGQAVSSMEVDPISIDCYSGNYVSPDLVYSSGTSLAAAYVTGVAGLVLSRDLGLSPPSLIDHLLNSVDEVIGPNGLVGMVKSGGRINASKAVSGGLPASVPVEAQGGGGGGALSLIWLFSLLIMLIFMHICRRGEHGTRRQLAVVAV